MNEWVLRTMIVASQDADLARSLANGITAGIDNDGMWRTGLSATGKAPATHYVSSGLIWAQFAALLGDTQATFDAAGGAIPLATIDGLYSRSVIADGEIPPLQVIADAGLKLIEGTV